MYLNFFVSTKIIVWLHRPQIALGLGSWHCLQVQIPPNIKLRCLILNDYIALNNYCMNILGLFTITIFTYTLVDTVRD